MEKDSHIEWARRFLALASLMVGAYVFAATLAMVIHAWSPVPVADQWDELVSGRNITWPWLISQHNEHRILFPRLVFIADGRWFAETNIFDFCVNVLLQLALVFSMFRLAVGSGIKTPWGMAWTAGFSFCLLFWAIQSENFIWGFQVTFLGLLPAACSSFALVATGLRERRAVFLAIILEVIAVYTLAGGIIVPFLNILLAIWVGRSRMTIALLALVALTLLVSYLAGYQAPSIHTNPLDSLDHLESLTAFSLVELGLPFGRTLGGYFTGWKILISGIAGGVGLLMFCSFVWLTLRRRREPAPHRIALVGVATFVVAMTLLTAAGRMAFGLETAMSSRYGTPVAAFWLSLTALAMAHFGLTVRRQVLVMLVCLPLQLLTLASQRHFVGVAENYGEARALSVPFLLAGVGDAEMLNAVYPSATRPLMLTERLRAAHTSIFRDPWVDWMATPLAKHLTVLDATHCHGTFARVERVVDGQPPGWRAWGSASFGDEKHPVRRLLFADAAGSIVGYGVGGFNLNRVLPNDFPPANGKSEWIGAFASSAPDSVVAYALAGDTPTACSLGTVRSSPSLRPSKESDVISRSAPMDTP